MSWQSFWLGFGAGRLSREQQTQKPLTPRRSDALLGAVVIVLLVALAFALVVAFWHLYNH
jgi:hypothetical protein